jgi:hypothetical protein
MHVYRILGSDYAEFARRDIGDVTITHISTPCNISTRAKNAYQWRHNEKVRHDKQICFQILKNFIFIYYGNFSLIVYDK